uniref:ZPR1 zinc finger domain-containing protein n=1 Tax=Fervidicoccus fontis TaxID=683846 RepID=A0A7J3ZIS9_9CREN
MVVLPVYAMVSSYYTEVISDCPLCGSSNTYTVRQMVYVVPRVGPTLIASGRCSSCGFRSTWILPMETSGEREIRIEVSKPGDLNRLVLVGENTDVLIPELELEFLSSELEPGYITTVEGILLRFYEKLEWLCHVEYRAECEEKLRELREALEGSKRLTIVLRDRYGRSALLY